MALLADYTAGTISVAEGETDVVGDGVAWKTAGFREGDIFIAAGYWAVVAANLEDEDALVLVDWAGPTLTDAPYRLRYMSDGSRASAQARQLIDLLGGSGSLEALAALVGVPNTIPYFTGAGTMGLLTRQQLTQGARYDVQVSDLSERDTYDDRDEGFAVLVSNVGDGRSAIYSREGEPGNWSDPAYVSGPVGPVGPKWVDWKGPWAAGTYGEGDGVEHDGNSYRATAETSQEPPNADWELLAGRGATGPEWIDWRGDWSAGEYTAGQGVTHDGSGYRANTTTTEAPPHADWDLIVSKGGKGDKGEGLAADITVDTLADRDEYDEEEPPFRIQVRDIGDGRSALYDKESAASGDWSAPAYVTGSAGASAAEDVSYDNAASGLAATDVQDAVDELAARPTVGAADDITYDNAGSDLDAENIQEAVDELAARQSIPPGYDQLLTAVAYNSMMLADTLAFAQFPAQDRVADSFDTLDYVDVAGATNLDTSQAGVLKPTATAGDRITGATPSAPLGGTAANINDDNPATSIGPNLGNLSGQPVGSRILGRLDFGSPVAISSVMVRANYLDSLPGCGIYYSDDGSSWTQLGSSFTITGSAADYSRSGPITARYVAFVVGANNYSSTAVTLATLNANAVPVTSNLTVATTALPIVGEPDIMSALMLVREIDSVTPGTDWGIRFSRNNGADWEDAPPNLIRSVPISGGITLKLYGTDNIDMTGETFATACKMQMWTANAKMVQFHAHHTYGA